MMELIFALLKKNNLEIINFGMVVETVGIGLTYITAVREKTTRFILTSLLMVYFMVWLTLRVFSHIPDTIDSLAETLGKLTIICLGIVYLYYQLKSEITSIALNPIFWVAAGSLLYAVGTIVIYGLANEKYKTLFHHSLAGMIKFRYEPLDANEALLEIFLCDSLDDLSTSLVRTIPSHLSKIFAALTLHGIIEEYEFSFVDT
jgi:hypothetical protein